MENNFFYLLQYSNASTVDDLNEQNIINELSYLLNNTTLNNDNYDIINYWFQKKDGSKIKIQQYI